MNQDGAIANPDCAVWHDSARLGDFSYLDNDINLDGQVTSPEYTMLDNNIRAEVTSQLP